MSDASEAVREALRLLQQRRCGDELKLEALRRAILIGREDAARSRAVIVEPDRIDHYLRGLGRTARLTPECLIPARFDRRPNPTGPTRYPQ